MSTLVKQIASHLADWLLGDHNWRVALRTLPYA